MFSGRSIRAVALWILALLACSASGFHQPVRPAAWRRSTKAGCGLRRMGTVLGPIGVPKVAYRIPGSNQADWVDIYNRLYRERIVFLGQEITDELANQIIGVLLYLDHEDSSKPIYLYINSPGGSVNAGLALYDTMNHIRAPVITVNVGLAASMASFLLAGGKPGSRMALPHSRVMIHQPMGGAQGQAEDIKVHEENIISGAGEGRMAVVYVAMLLRARSLTESIVAAHSAPLNGGYPFLWCAPC